MDFACNITPENKIINGVCVYVFEVRAVEIVWYS